MIGSTHRKDRRNWQRRLHNGRSAICAARLVLIVGSGAIGASSLLLGSAFAGPTVPLPGDQGTFRVQTATPLSRCLATWNNTSGMSKREWKQTCKRVVKQNPGLYGKPF